MSHKITFEFIVEEIDPGSADILKIQPKLEKIHNEVEILLDKKFEVSHSVFEVSEIFTRM